MLKRWSGYKWKRYFDDNGILVIWSCSFILPSMFAFWVAGRIVDRQGLVTNFRRTEAKNVGMAESLTTKMKSFFPAELQKYITCIFSLDSRTCHKIKLEVSCRGAPQQRVSCHLALSWSYDLLSPRGHILFVVATVMSILFHLEIFKNSFILSQIHIAAFDCLFL